MHSLALLYETEVLSRLVRVVAIQGVLIHLHPADTEEDYSRFDDYLETLDILQAEIRGWHGAWSEFCKSRDMDPAVVLLAFRIRLPPQGCGKGGLGVGKYCEVENQTKLAAMASMTEIFVSTIGDKT